MSIALHHAEALAQKEAKGGVIAPLLMGVAFAVIALFGAFLAARAPDQYGYVAGFGFMTFGFLMSMRYYSRRI